MADSIIEITLTQGKVTLLDERDLQLVCGYKWSAHKCSGKFYARAWNKGAGGDIYMHNLILGFHPGYLVDHKNGNSLDNRRDNLRLATLLDNNRNIGPLKGAVSRYKGVFWEAGKSKWRARIRTGTDKGRISLGYFTNEEEAARAYDEAAKIFHGEFAYLNFPP